jgi:hypothetical protein
LLQHICQLVDLLDSDESETRGVIHETSVTPSNSLSTAMPQVPQQKEWSIFAPKPVVNLVAPITVTTKRPNPSPRENELKSKSGQLCEACWCWKNYLS